MNPLLKKRIWSVAKNAILWLAACAAVSFFLTSLWCFAPSGNDSSQWKSVFGHYAVVVFTWGILVFLIYPSMKWIGWDGRPVFLTGFLYLAAGIIFSFMHLALSHVVMRASGVFFHQQVHPTEFTIERLFGVIQSNMLLFAIIASVCVAINYFRKFREREVRTFKLENQLTAVQLTTLKAQLQPHFLFNSLNAIAALTREDPALAESMIVKLSELLRLTLENTRNDEHRLTDEMAFLRKYLQIEKMRFGKRLEIIENIDPQSQNAMLPTLLLQPIVENSIVHGVSKTATCVTIRINVKVIEKRLNITITDNGPGLKISATSRVGHGLQNTRERLACLYKEQGTIKTSGQKGQGYSVEITLPFRPCDKINEPFSENQVNFLDCHDPAQVFDETTPDKTNQIAQGNMQNESFNTDAAS